MSGEERVAYDLNVTSYYFNSLKLQQFLFLFSIAISLPVADPGFPVGGADLQRVRFSVKTYAKTKELDPVGAYTSDPWIRQWLIRSLSIKNNKMAAILKTTTLCSPDYINNFLDILFRWGGACL